MSNQLLPCPCCGGKPMEMQYDGILWVQCADCALNTAACDSSADYVQLWNRRTTQPAAEQLWAVHAQGPDDLFAAFSREDAEADAAAFNALPCPPGISVSAVVIESPWPAAEHWKYLAEQWKYLADKEQESNSPPAAAHRGEAVAEVFRKGFDRGSLVWTNAGSKMDLADGTKLYAMRAQAGEGGEV